MPACQVLFGAAERVGAGFLDALHEDQLKSVFRRRAFETHPDRATSVGLDPRIMTARFQEVQAARDLLSRFIVERANRKLTVRSAPTARPSEPARRRARRTEECFWTGRVPARQLLLGEYLYYSGRISMQALIAAIRAHVTPSTQRGAPRAAQRPFGRYFTETGLLSDVVLAECVRAQRMHNMGRAARRAS